MDDVLSKRHLPAIQLPPKYSRREKRSHGPSFSDCFYSDDRGACDCAQQSSGQVDGRAPGLYMTFETSMGDIHCKLFENEAPLTVKTIVGLAIGKMSYVDPRTKQKVTGKPFYDGLTFHRVIPQFMIQGGDPLGTRRRRARRPRISF